MKFSRLLCGAVLAALGLTTSTQGSGQEHGRGRIDYYTIEKLKVDKKDIVLPAAAVRVDSSTSLQARANPTWRLEMGNQKQHVGQITGQQLYDEIYNCLNEDLCLEVLGTQCVETPSIDCALSRDCPGTCIIDNVQYNAQGELAANAWLIISIEESYFPADYYDLRHILISAVASTYMAMTDTGKNCYDAVVGDDWWEHWCNVAEYVRIDIGNWHAVAAGPTPKLHVRLNFNGATTEGHFDCVGSETPVIDEIHSAGYIGTIASMVRRPRHSIKEDFICPNKEVTRADSNALTHAADRDLEVIRNTPENPVKLHIQMGNLRQHAGWTIGNNLYVEVKRCLDKICPDGHETCTKSGEGDAYINCRINGVAYNAKGNVAYNSHLDFLIAGSFFPPGYPGLRNSLVEVVARTYEAMSQIEKNCYHVTLNSKWERMCNINQYVWVELAHWYGKNEELSEPGARLSVDLSFNGKTTEGEFDCVGSETPVIDALHKYGQMAKIAKIIGEDAKTMVEWIDCPIKDVDGEETPDDRTGPTPPVKMRKHTSTSLQKRGPSSLQKRTKNTVHIRISSQRQHIGVLVGEKLWRQVYQVLENLCGDAKDGYDTCKRYYDTIEGIVYNAKGNWATNAFMKVKVGVSYFPKPWFKEPLMMLAAAGFSVFSEAARNCYDVDLGGHGRVQMCNVPEVVFIHVDEVAWLWVEMRFNGDTTEGPLDCKGTLGAVVNWLDDSERYNFARALGIKVGDLGSYSRCSHPA